MAARCSGQGKSGPLPLKPSVTAGRWRTPPVLAPRGLPVPCFSPCPPPAGFNVETVEYKNISFTVWDVGGQDKVGQHPPAAMAYWQQRQPGCLGPAGGSSSRRS